MATAERKDTDRKLSDIHDTAESTRDGMPDFVEVTSSMLADRTTELERLRQLSRDMMKKLAPIDELTAEINEMRTERIRELPVYSSWAKTYLPQAKKPNKSSSGFRQFLCRVIMLKHTKTW